MTEIRTFTEVDRTKLRASFPSEDDHITQAITKYRLFLRPRPAAFLVRGMADAMWAAVRRRPTAKGFDDPRWPAHLRINVAPEARGTGAAAGLMLVVAAPAAGCGPASPRLSPRPSGGEESGSP